jgi:DNA-binding Lrp family transcriptional regulator
MAAGFTVIPSVLIDRQKALGLDAIDLNILMHMATKWWYADNAPYPSKRTLADAIGVHPSTIQRHIRAMEKANLIRRESRSAHDRGQLSNRYDLSPLITAAIPLAEEEIERRAKAQEAEAAQRQRRRPRGLRAVKA